MTLTDLEARTPPLSIEEHSSRWAYLAALAPIIFGTTYLLTTEFLPPDRPLLAALGAVVMLSLATVLTKRWGSPRGMNAIGVTGWIFVFAGLTLLPVTLIFEGLPDHLTGRNIGGLVYLVLITGIAAYALWFWGLRRLSATSITFLTLPNPVVAAILGWAVLDQPLNGWQLFGAVIVLVSVVLGQAPGTQRSTIETELRRG